MILLCFYVFISSTYSLDRSTPDAGTPGAAADGEGGPAAPAPNLTSNRRLQQTQAQVDEVRTRRGLIMM